MTVQIYRGEIRRGRMALLAATAMIGLTAGGAAQAQTAQRGVAGAEDIVVTARLRSDSLIDVPVAISVVTGEQLSMAAAADLTKIADFVPNLIIQRGSAGSGGELTLRGVSSSSSDGGIESSVSINVDGVSITRGYITQAAFFDLEQVEVLKGPQALFFGKNSPAGVVSLRSAGPTSELFASAKVAYEMEAEERIVEGVLSGPITRTLGARLAVRHSAMEGYLRNRALPIASNPFDPGVSLPGPVGNDTTPKTNDWAARLTVAWQPTDNFQAEVKLLQSWTRNNEGTGGDQIIRCAGDHPLTLGVPDPYNDCKADGNRASTFINPAYAENYPYLDGKRRPFGQTDLTLATLKLDFTLSNITFTSLTSLLDLHSLGWGNFDYTSFARFNGINGEDTRNWTQELRLLTDLGGVLNFAAGVIYEDSKRTSFHLSRSVGVQGPDPVTGSQATNWGNGDTHGSMISGFGQAIWRIIPQVELTAGVRYTREIKKANIQNLYLNQYNPAAVAHYLPVGTVIRGYYKDDNWSPEVTLSWYPAPNQTLYAAYKTGYKSGGFSNTAQILRNDNEQRLRFEAESAKGGEIGYKAELFGRTLSLDAVGYYFEYTDLQRTAYDVLNNSFVVRNAASAIVKGLELSGTWRTTDRLTFNLSSNFNKAHYDTFPAAPCYNGQTPATGCITLSDGVTRVQDRTGQRLARAPEWVVAGGVRYEQPVGNNLLMGFSADAKYSASYRTQEDGDPVARQSSYWKLGAGVRVFDADDKWEVALVGRNLLNEYVVLRSNGKPGGAPGDLLGTVDRPRELILSGMIRF